MEEVVLTWTPGNWLTVVLMVVLGYIAFRVMVLLYARAAGNT